MTGGANATTAGHGLLCPACRIDLVMSERQGIEIDYCPKCRGVWLDRGELDKIVERNEGQPGGRTAPGASGQPYPVPGDRGHHGSGHGDYGYGKHGRRKSWLGDLFD